jgi:hypothetical protein
MEPSGKANSSCVITAAIVLLGIHGDAEISKELRPSNSGNSGFETAPFQNWCSVFKSLATYVCVPRASVTHFSTRRIMKILKETFVITKRQSRPCLEASGETRGGSFIYIHRQIHA